MKLSEHPWVHKSAIIAATVLSLAACTTTQQYDDGNGNVSRTVQTVGQGALAGAAIATGLTLLGQPEAGLEVIATNAFIGGAVGGAAAYAFDFLNNPVQGNVQTTNVNVVAPA